MSQAAEAASSRPRTSSLAAVVLLLSLLMLITGQVYLEARRIPAQGKLIFLLGLALAWSVLAATTRAVEQTQPTSAARPFPCRRVWPLLAISAVFATLSAVYAGRGTPVWDAALLWLAGMGIMVGVFVAYQVFARPRLPSLRLAPGPVLRQRLLETLALCAIMALALYLRVFDLTDIPPYIHGDEAFYGTDARDLRDLKVRTLFDNAFQDQPRLTTLPAALIMKVWDDGLGALRLSAALTGVLTLPFLYLLSRIFVGRAAALLAVFLLAVARVDIHFSRQGINSIQMAPLTVAAMYFLLRAVRRRSISDGVVCGIIGGIALYSYFPGRFIPFFIGILLLFAIVSDRQHWRSYAGIALAILTSALIVFAPMLGYYVTHTRQLLSHQQSNLWINNLRHVTGGAPSITIPMIWMRQIEQTFWGFNYYRDTSGQYGATSTLLDPATAILMFLGLVICLCRWRDAGHFLLIVWFVLTNFLVGVIVVGPPSAPRLCGLLPALCLMAGIAVDHIWCLMKERGVVPGAVTAVIGLGLVPAIALLSNYNAYFRLFVPSKTYDPQAAVARYLKEQAGSVTPYSLGAEIDPNNSIVRLIAPGVAGHQMVTLEDWLPLRQVPDNDALYYAGEGFVPALSFVRDYYADATLDEHRTADGRIIFAAYRVAHDDLIAKRGLVGRYHGVQAGLIVQRRDPQIAFDWATDTPHGFGQEIEVEWEGSLFAPTYGNHRLRLEGSGQAEIILDGTSLARKDSTQAATEGARSLAKGWHSLRIVYHTTGGSLRLLWQPPGGRLELIPGEAFMTDSTVKGLLASYFEGTDTARSPVFQVIEPAVFARLSPYSERFGWGKPYVSTWSGKLNVPVTGAYVLGARAFEGSLSLLIDGNAVLEFQPVVYDIRQGKVSLTAGAHDIEVVFRCPTGRFGRIELWWQPPGGAFVPIPPSALAPPAPSP